MCSRTAYSSVSCISFGGRIRRGGSGTGSAGDGSGTTATSSPSHAERSFCSLLRIGCGSMSEPLNDNDAIWPGAVLPESRFFEPSERCPAPQYFHSTDGDSTEREVAEFIGALVRVAQPEYVVELGAAFGETTHQIVTALTRNGHGRLVTLEVDPVRAQYVRDRLSAYENWEIVEQSSLEWLPPPDAPPIGVLFSDTLRDIRVQELLRFLPYMRPCGLAAVHDSGWDVGAIRGNLEQALVKPGLARAIDFPTSRGLTLLEIHPGNGG